MALPALALAVADAIMWLEDKTPKDEDVKAGWTAFAIFLLLIGAVVVLGFSLSKQLRKAQAAEDAGVYGRDEEAPSAAVSGPAGPEGQSPGTTPAETS
jgi:hypothetical protein